MTYNLIYPNLNFAHKKEKGPHYEEVFEKHFHLIYELLFFVSGNVDLVLENKIYHLKPNDLVLIKPGQHHYVIPQSEEIYERYVIKFPEYVIPNELLEIIKNKPTLTSISDTTIINLFASLDEHYLSYKGQHLNLILENVLKMILSYFSSLEESEKNKGNIYSQKMNKVINYINENLAEPLMIEDICKHFHYSKSYIVKEFKASLGVPIKQYIITKKILLAESLISKGNKPTEIYNKCGFEDYSTFYRNYIKIVGKAPSLGGALTIPSSDVELN